MNNNKKDWIHSDNNIGDIIIDITQEDVHYILEGNVFDWCYPVYGKDKNGTKVILGNVNVAIGNINSEETEWVAKHQNKKVTESKENV